MDPRRLPDELASRNIVALAEHVDTPLALAAALDADYLLFQGSFFRKPAVELRKQLPANELAYLRLLAL